MKNKVLVALLITTLILAGYAHSLRQRIAHFDAYVFDLTTQLEARDEAIRVRDALLREIVKQGPFRVKLVDTFTVTAYAPLDPNAIEGVCFEGDPTDTASGAPVIIGVTAAAGRNLPFGSWVWVDGFGWRIVTDRGGAIGSRNIDVAVASRGEAFRWGRQQRTVVVVEKEGTR